MTPDILFWFYKEFDVCRDRLLNVRKMNADVKVFALYGGDVSKSNEAQNAIIDLVDDFYAYPEERTPKWKWKQGEQLIAAWHRDRGQYLEWDTLFIMQWDMIILSPIGELFRHLEPGHVLFSGYTPLKDVEAWWPWGQKNHSELIAFKNYLKNELSYTGELYACLFIIVCLPKAFLDNFIELGSPETGFLEYKMPTLANAFNIPVSNDNTFIPWWAANPDTKNAPWHEKTLNAVSESIPTSAILSELAKPNGKRIFHPVFKIIPNSIIGTKHPGLVKYVFYIFEFFANLPKHTKQQLKNILLRNN